MKAPQFLQHHAVAVESALHSLLQARKSVIPEPLYEAMIYALMAGGKRVRPALLLESYLVCGGSDPSRVLNAAAAIECIHTYSLIHDDLPCMDDDDLRRGKPTCHKAFDEATAVLAADALQSLAFELLAEMPGVDAKLRCRLLHSLAVAAGAQGMVGGQVLDMQGEHDAEHGKQMTLLEVERIHLHKTGALLHWCCEAGAMLAEVGDVQQQACSRYGKAVGLLFQIADDMLDVTASSAALGKSAGKDAAQHKATYVSILGLEHARELAEEMCDVAVESCRPLASEGASLRELAHYILERNQ